MHYIYLTYFTSGKEGFWGFGVVGLFVVLASLIMAGFSGGISNLISVMKNNMASVASNEYAVKYQTGAWCYYEGGDIDLKNTDAGEFNLSLRKFKDPTQNAQQFVIPS